MYQYINAVMSGVEGVRNILKGRGCRSCKSLEKKKLLELVGGYGDVVFAGLGFTLSLLLGMLALELFVKSLPVSAINCVAIITAVSAVFIILTLLKNEAVNKNSTNLELKYKNTLAEKIVLEQQISELMTHSDIAHAAARSRTFGSFMGSIASLLRKDKSARELTIFTNKNDCIAAHTYYQLSDFSELCLSFTGTYFDDNKYNEHGPIRMDPNLFSAQNLALEYVEGDITIDGSLLYDNETVGELRVTLFDCTEKSHSFQELLEGIVQNALSSVDISFAGIEAALSYKSTKLTRDLESMNTLMLQLEVSDNVLGVVKLAFDNGSEESIGRQKSILQTASSHISKALYNQNLYELAIKDGLTNLFNKRYLLDTLQKNFSSVLLGAEKLSFVLVDIDYFKKVNDTWGHLVGDDVLKRVAEILSQTAREGDVVARYGGEELAILMPRTDAVGAEILAERIRANIEREVFTSGTGENFSITASFGVAELEQDMIAPESLVEDSDKALYLAKNGGRNRVVVSKKIVLMQDVA